MQGLLGELRLKCLEAVELLEVEGTCTETSDLPEALTLNFPLKMPLIEPSALPWSLLIFGVLPLLAGSDLTPVVLANRTCGYGIRFGGLGSGV